MMCGTLVHGFLPDVHIKSPGVGEVLGSEIGANE